MKYLAIFLLLLFFGATIYWSIMTPVMIPTLMVAWVMLWLQAKFQCFN
ncbi:Hypothetical protein KNT65_gp042 [Escherichia phage EcS1]|uniref:Uncharacterized protein n=1 Tax=Escherichia phage EcS1 TaxID=2083276 RepID=A0A2Z5ZBY1_9CAUD|nr:Hypothetical protein KNT65_gp042 [Escherichia phage EcS1]BBC78090.1 Hypothetical protein [Escherichia phage EcS1]